MKSYLIWENNNANGQWLSTAKFFYKDYTLIEESNASNIVQKEFVWDPSAGAATRPLYMRAPQKGTNLIYFHDANKNVSELHFLHIPNGIAAHYEYDAFGNVTKSTRNTTVTGTDYRTFNPFQFSSEYFDAELGLIYYNYRHYNPSSGRFLSRDPIAESGGFNLYLLCYNSLSNYYDRLGQSMIAPGAYNPSRENPNGGRHTRGSEGSGFNRGESKLSDIILPEFHLSFSDFTISYSGCNFSISGSKRISSPVQKWVVGSFEVGAIFKGKLCKKKTAEIGYELAGGFFANVEVGIGAKIGIDLGKAFQSKLLRNRNYHSRSAQNHYNRIRSQNLKDREEARNKWREIQKKLEEFRPGVSITSLPDCTHEEFSIESTLTGSFYFKAGVLLTYEYTLPTVEFDIYAQKFKTTQKKPTHDFYVNTSVEAHVGIKIDGELLAGGVL